MAFQLSPGVNVSEIDLTTVVPAVATSDGAIGGVFRWGPIGQRLLVDSESALVARYGKPTNFNAETWFTAANFLSYGASLYVSRAANTSGSTPYLWSSNSTNGSNAVLVSNATVSNNILTCNTTGLAVGMYITQSENTTIIPTRISILTVNSTAITVSKNLSSGAIGPAQAANTAIYFGRPETAYTAVGLSSASSNATIAALASQIVKNSEDYIVKDGTFDTDIAYLAKYPGAMGNSLRVSVCDTSNSYSSAINVGVGYARFTVGSNEMTAKTAGATPSSQIAVGDQILAGNGVLGTQYLQVVSVTGGVDASVNTTSLEALGTSVAINASSGFLQLKLATPYNDGDIVSYSNTAGNTTLVGLVSLGINGTNSFFVVSPNTTGLYLANTLGGTPLLPVPASSSEYTLKGNTYLTTVTFSDPYRLREGYDTQSVTRNWEFFNIVGVAPGQSNWQYNYGNTSANDEMHIVVVDEGGDFSGTPGTVLEVYKSVSRATDAKNTDGSTNYYKNVINQDSQYIWWANDRTSAVSNSSLNLISSTASAPLNMQFKLGADGKDESTTSFSTIAAAYDLFGSAEDIDVSLIMQGKPISGTTVVGGQTVTNFQLGNYIIDNICEVRKDCVGFISPDKSIVYNNIGNEATSLKNWRGALRSTSYAVLDSGYKYQYDRYNDVNRWIPLNGDIAGLCARTDKTNDAWWSPAGFNRGAIKNIIKLAYNPRKSERDVLFSNGINPVISQPGQGIVLYGDKTLQAKPSAFDHINVRRLFIVLEKAISRAAKYSLFEFNDSFTRAQFKNLITPYLRSIQGSRGITDFLVVCDDTNNTPQVVDSNQFVGDIYIKPARSINFIQLNFVAVPTGVQFSEVVGQF